MSDNSGYQLPCVYCSGENEVHFESSAQLKDHLLKRHPNLVSSSCHGQFDSPNRKQVNMESPSKAWMGGRDSFSPLHNRSPKSSKQLVLNNHNASSTSSSAFSPDKSNHHYKRESLKANSELSIVDYISSLNKSSKVVTGMLDPQHSEETINNIKIKNNEKVLKENDNLRKRFKECQGIDGMMPGKVETQLSLGKNRSRSESDFEEIVLKAESIIHAHSNSSSHEDFIRGSSCNILQPEYIHTESSTQSSSSTTIENDIATERNIGDQDDEKIYGLNEILRGSKDTSFNRRILSGEQKLNLGLLTGKEQIFDALEGMLRNETIQCEQSYSLPSHLEQKNDIDGPEKEKILALEDLLQSESKENNSLKEQLLDERQKNEDLVNEVKTIKNKLKEQENHTDLENSEIVKQLRSTDEINEDLNEKVMKLKTEKEKLIDKLKEADLSLKKLSRRASLTKSSPKSEEESSELVPHKGTMGFVMKYMEKQLKKNLDHITNTVQQISTKENSSRKELFELKDELHRVTLLLTEEKLKHDQVKTINSELEQTITVLSEFEEQKGKICDELCELRKEHKKCALNESALKQTKREKKGLLREHKSLKSKCEILSTRNRTLKEEMTTKELKFKEEVSGEFLNNKKNVDMDAEVIAKLRNELEEKEKVIKEYDEVHLRTLEEMKKTRLELEKMKNDDKKDNPYIKNLNRSMNDVRICLTDIQSEKSQKYDDLESLNAKLRVDVAYLGEKLSETEDEMEALKGKISQMDITKIENESEIGKLTEELERSRLLKKNVDDNIVSEKSSKIIESLILEKDILSSRVLILEGIGENMEILKNERDRLKKSNDELRGKLHDKMKVKSCFSDGDISISGLVNLKNKKNQPRAKPSKQKQRIEQKEEDCEDDILETMKSISELDENDKHRLQDMLSHPMFEEFLSSTSSSLFDLDQLDMEIDQKSDSKTHDPENEYYEQEDVTCHKSYDPSLDYSPEYVQKVYLPEPESEDTLDYSESVNRINGNYEEDDDDEEEETSGKKLVLKDSMKKLGKVKRKLSKKKFVGGKKKGKRIRKTSKKNLLIRERSDEVFEKIHELSKEKELNSSLKNQASPMKQVKFSDKHFEIKKSNESLEDSNLYKSYLQECLEDEYPILATSSEEDIEKELKFTSFSPESVSPLSVERDSPVLTAEKNFINESLHWIHGVDSDKEDIFSIKERYKNLGLNNTDQGYNSTTSSVCSTTKNDSCAKLELEKKYVYDHQQEDLSGKEKSKDNNDFIDKYKKTCMEFTEKKRIATDALNVLKSFMNDTDIDQLKKRIQDSTQISLKTVT